ncbi:hypothetical protein ACWDTI_01715 [Gordonia sp. NPDC003424]
MTATAAGTDMVTRVAALTGFDARAVDGTATGVAVFGIGGTGVTSLVEACHVVDPSVPIVEGHWGRRDPLGIALMVLDPSSSIGEEERQAVEDLRSRYGIVALVCTKIDAFWEWPRILRAHRGVLDPREQLPIFAVSSVAALSGAPDESGVPAILDWIREHLAAPTDLRVQRARIAAALGAVEHTERRILDAADPDVTADTIDRLSGRRRILLESRDRGRADRLSVARTGLARARSQSLAEVAAGCRALAAAATTRCAALTAGGVDEYVRWLTDETVGLRQRTDRAVDDRIDEVRSVTTVGVDGSPADAELPPQPADADSVQALRRPVPTGRRGAEDALLVVIGASTGLGIGRLIVAPMASVQTLQWVSMPLTLLLGVAVAALVIRVRRTAALRGEMRGWTTEVLGETRGLLDQRVGLRLAAAEPRLAGQITRFYERRARQAAADVADIDNRLRKLRGSGADDTRDRLAKVRAAHRELAALSTALMGED